MSATAGPQGPGSGSTNANTGSQSQQASAVADVTQIFDMLESSNAVIVQEVKDIILDNLNNTKENWLVHGLYDYYVQSGSSRCSEILCGISREPHDKYLIEKMTEGIRSMVKEPRRLALILLGHAVCKQPSWLYKITHFSLFKELIKLLKTETDVVILMTGLLSLIMMLPIIPMSIVAYIQEFFDVFGRLATWTNTTHNIPKEHVLHLQVGLYSLFHRLYAMFPCNFLSYLRHNFGTPDKRTVFLHTIMPMLEKVKMHPKLVTATRDAELSTSRWQSRDYHDIIAECSKISLDCYESSLPEEIPAGFSANFVTNLDGTVDSPSDVPGGLELNLEDMLKIPSSHLVSQAMDTADISSLQQFIEDISNTAPPTPLSITSPGQISNYPHPVLTVKTNVTAETAMEATPENTPIKDKERSHFKLPLHNTPAAIQLFGPKEELVLKANERNERPVPHTPPATPYSSVPSSPLPVTSTLTRRDSIFDSSRREPLMLQRLQKVQMEQQAAQQAQIQQQQQQTSEAVQTTPIPPPPLPLSASTAATQTPQASLPVEVTRKVAVVAPAPHAPLESNSESVADSDKSATSVGGGGPLTPVPGQSVSPSVAGLIDPALSLITLDEEPANLEECSTTACTSGGLHMADHQSMVAFAKRVNNRLRYHSHCISGTDYNNSLGPSPGTSPSSTSSAGALLARARYMKRSLSCPDIKKPVSDDSSFKKTPKLPEVSEVGTGSEEQKEAVSDDVIEENPEEPEQEAITKEPEHPYEHLFQKILPGVMSPIENRTLPSPHRLLDLCLVRAAHVQNINNVKNDEASLLKGHIELLHCQLLFERHRREAHAYRNRRLAGKCRKAANLEEQNSTMGQKIHNLEKEIASLKKEVTLQKNMGLVKERELINTIEDLEAKLEASRKETSDITQEKIRLEAKYSRLSEQFNALYKESDQKEAGYFGLESEIKNCQKYIERNKELKTAYESRLKEIILLGELLRKYREVSGPPAEYRYLMEQLDDYRLTYEEEVRTLKSQLELVKSQQDASNGNIADLKKRLEKRETIIEDQRKEFQEKEQEHQMQIHALENKYETIKNTNQRLELEILSLQHQLSLKTANTRPTRGRIASASSPSNNGEVSPAGNSNHSDVDSAASAGGFQMSPERNVFIFGSPQFDNPSDEMRDLQAMLDREPISATGLLPASSRRRNSSPLTHSRDIGFRH